MAGVAGRKAPLAGRLFPDPAAFVDELELHLTVTDRDSVDELSSYAAGEERESFALRALRIGVLALRQARGQVDADLIQRETHRMLAGMQAQLSAHSAQIQGKCAAILEFDELIDLIHGARESSHAPAQLNQHLPNGNVLPADQDAKDHRRLI